MGGHKAALFNLQQWWGKPHHYRAQYVPLKNAFQGVFVSLTPLPLVLEFTKGMNRRLRTVTLHKRMLVL